MTSTPRRSSWLSARMMAFRSTLQRCARDATLGSQMGMCSTSTTSRSFSEGGRVLDSTASRAPR
jgi:hypothetical protein